MDDKQQYLDSLEEVVLDPILITGRVEDLDAELQTNMRTLQLDSHLAQEVTADDLTAVIQRVIDNREVQVLQMGMRGIFYLWFGEQIPAIRFNFISAAHSELPFQARLRVLDSPKSIVESFLASPIHDGVPILDVLIHLAEDEYVEIDAEQPLVLVYAVTPPRSPL